MADMPEPPESLRIVPVNEDAADFEVLTDQQLSGGQHNLFASDELYLPESVSTYRKPVAAIHSIPERRDASLKLSARKLMEAMPLAVQLDIRSRPKAAAQELIRKIKEDRASPLFEIRTKELARLAGLATTNMERIHETLAELVGFKFIWNVLGEDGEAKYESIAPFLTRRDRGIGSRVGWTRFAFEPEILLWFLEPSMWATLSWTVMSSVGRDSGPGQEAAFGMYQNIWRYIGTSAKMTPALDVATWIDLFIGPSRFVQVDAKGNKKVVDYKDFKRRYLLPGLDILNNMHALNHTAKVKEDTSGRKVVKLRFLFERKVQDAFELPLGWPQEALKALDEIGYSEEEVSTLSQLTQYPLVAEALSRFAQAEQRAQKKGTRMYSRRAYFDGILKNVAKGAALSEEEDAKLLKEAERREQKEREEKRMRVLREKFAAHQDAVVKAELGTLPPERRDALIDEYLTAKPEARLMVKKGVLGSGALTLFRQWLLSAKPDLTEEWLPEAKDREFDSWLAWQLSSRL